MPCRTHKCKAKPMLKSIRIQARIWKYRRAENQSDEIKTQLQCNLSQDTFTMSTLCDDYILSVPPQVLTAGIDHSRDPARL